MANGPNGHRSPERQPLTRERVLRAALELADEDGIDALTMRELGLRLGVEAMSLYNHVANKDDILDGMVDLVVGEIDLPAGRGRLGGGDAREGDLGPGGLRAAPLGQPADRLARQQRARAGCATSTG